MLTEFWLSKRQYRFKHPETGRTQDIYFNDAEESDDWPVIIKARRAYAENELCVEKENPKPKLVGKFDTAAVAHSNRVFNDQILTGKIDPCPDIATSKYFFEKPSRLRTLW